MTITATARKWANKKQIAEYYGVTTRTIENWMTEGLPYHQAGKHKKVLFNLAECDEWMAGKKDAA